MLIEFSITNYRSLKAKTTLSLIADNYESKCKNVNVHNIAGGKQVRLLNTILIYGPNGSGKSNIIRAFWDLLGMLKSPSIAGSGIQSFDPFKFNSDSYSSPTQFEIKFLDNNNIPYFYSVSFNGTSIISEELKYWPNGRETIAFKRNTDFVDEGIHILEIGQSAQEDRSQEKIYSNNFGISHFSTLSPNKIILSAFSAIQNISVFNTLNNGHRYHKRNFGELLRENEIYSRKINALIKYSDLNIEAIEATEDNAKSLDLDDSIDSKKKYTLQSLHNFFNGLEASNRKISIPFREESEGSKSMLGLGTEIILVLEKGGVLFVDEFETSLHSSLSKSLIQIFQNEKLNPLKAQLIFTTHDTNLMDHLLFRRDQIYFTSKNNMGETNLYSMVDFPDIREAHVFEKWYLSGKLGALPKLDLIENAFG